MGGDLGQAYQKANTEAAWPDGFKDRLCRVADMLKSRGYEAEVSDLCGDPKPGKKIHVSRDGVHAHGVLSPSKRYTVGTFLGDLLRDAVGDYVTQGKDAAYLYIDEVNGRRQRPFETEYRIDTPRQAQRLAHAIERFMETQIPAAQNEHKPTVS
jgi:hypothetical protein